MRAADEFTQVLDLDEFPEDFRERYPRKDIIVINAVRCTVCGDLIASRHRHDFKSCKCGATFVDGGRDYCRYGYRTGHPPDALSVFRPQTDTEYQDYLNAMWDFQGPPASRRMAARWPAFDPTKNLMQQISDLLENSPLSTQEGFSEID